MKNVAQKLRVVHYPQVGSCKESFTVEVKEEEQAYLISETLGNQHLWLFDNKIISDFSNVILVQMYNEEDKQWEDYYNEEEFMDWDEIETEYFIQD